MEKPATQKLKEFWGSLFSSNTPAEGEEDGKLRYTPERLQVLYETLHRHPLINDNNKAVVVETVRSIAEFMIWGDQHEPRIFDFFLEHNIMVYLLNILQQPASRIGDVAKQVLQTLSIIIQNVRSETGIFFLFSNNHVNNIVSSNFDFEDEEVLGYYISFLKAISLKLNPLTVRFFLLKDPTPSSLTTTPVAAGPSAGKGAPSSMEGLRFPLYTEALKFAHHKEGMVRAGVRTLTLNVYSVPDASIQAFVSTTESVRYFAEVADYLAQQFEILSASMSTAEGFGQQALSQLDSQIAEVEDMLSYCNDVFTTAHPYTAHMLAQALWQRLAGPYWFKPLLYTTHADASDAPPIKLQASMYILERVFQLIMYPPLLSNILLSLLAPSTPSHAPLSAHVPPQPWAVLSGVDSEGAAMLSCRGALLALLSMRTPLAAPAAVRMLVAITQCRSLPPGILASLDLQPQPSQSPEHGLSSQEDNIIAKLAAERSSSSATGPPILTPVLAPPSPLLGYGYYTVWSVTTPPSLPLPPTEEELLGGSEDVEEGGQLQGSAALRHEHELEQLGEAGQQQQQQQQEAQKTQHYEHEPKREEEAVQQQQQQEVQKTQQYEQLEQAAREGQEQEQQMQIEQERCLQVEQQQQQQQEQQGQEAQGWGQEQQQGALLVGQQKGVQDQSAQQQEQQQQQQQQQQQPERDTWETQEQAGEPESQQQQQQDAQAQDAPQTEQEEKQGEAEPAQEAGGPGQNGVHELQQQPQQSTTHDVDLLGLDSPTPPPSAPQQQSGASEGESLSTNAPPLGAEMDLLKMGTGSDNAAEPLARSHAFEGQEQDGAPPGVTQQQPAQPQATAGQVEQPTEGQEQEGTSPAVPQQQQQQQQLPAQPQAAAGQMDELPSPAAVGHDEQQIPPAAPAGHDEQAPPVAAAGHDEQLLSPAAPVGHDEQATPAAAVGHDERRIPPAAPPSLDEQTPHAAAAGHDEQPPPAPAASHVEQAPPEPAAHHNERAPSPAAAGHDEQPPPAAAAHHDEQPRPAAAATHDEQPPPAAAVSHDEQAPSPAAASYDKPHPPSPAPATSQEEPHPPSPAPADHEEQATSSSTTPAAEAAAAAATADVRPDDANESPVTPIVARQRVKPNMTVATSSSELDGMPSYRAVQGRVPPDVGSMVDDLVEGVVRAHLGHDGRSSSMGGTSVDGTTMEALEGGSESGAGNAVGDSSGSGLVGQEVSNLEESPSSPSAPAGVAAEDAAAAVRASGEGGSNVDEHGGVPPPPAPAPPQPSPPPPQQPSSLPVLQEELQQRQQQQQPSPPEQPVAADLVDGLLCLIAAPHLPPLVLSHAAVLMRTWLGTHALPLRLQHPYIQPNQQQQHSPAPLSDAAPPSTPTAAAGGSALYEPWACTMGSAQRQALAAALHDAFKAAYAELDGMWCEAFFTLLCLEWQAVGQAIKRPALRATSDALMGGPHLYPPVPPQAALRPQGMGLSAAAALRTHLCVQRLVGLLQLLRVLHEGEPSLEAPVPHLPDLKLRPLDITEGQQVPMSQDNAIQCQVSFQPSQEKRVYFSVTGPALPSAAELLLHATPAGSGPKGPTEDPLSTAASETPAAANANGLPLVFEAGALHSAAALNTMHSSPAIVLGEASATRLNTGVVVSMAPLMGGAPYVDPNVPRWLHVHVRPSVRGLLRLMHEAQMRKGGLLYTLRSLADGHWVLAFQNGDRCREAHARVQQHALQLRGLYKQLAHAFVTPLLEPLQA